MLKNNKGNLPFLLHSIKSQKPTGAASMTTLTAPPRSFLSFPINTLCAEMEAAKRLYILCFIHLYIKIAELFLDYLIFAPALRVKAIFTG